MKCIIGNMIWEKWNIKKPAYFFFAVGSTKVTLCLTCCSRDDYLLTSLCDVLVPIINLHTGIIPACGINFSRTKGEIITVSIISSFVYFCILVRGHTRTRQPVGTRLADKRNWAHVRFFNQQFKERGFNINITFLSTHEQLLHLSGIFVDTRNIVIEKMRCAPKKYMPMPKYLYSYIPIQFLHRKKIDLCTSIFSMTCIYHVRIIACDQNIC